jgi:glycosyltransferase involved in cell wall biosynthesis
MKLFHVIGALEPAAGAERMVARLALYQRQEQGIEPVLITLVRSGPLGEELRRAGIPVHCLGLKGPLSFAGAVWRLSRLISREKPQIIQTWMYHSDLIGSLAGLLAGNRNVIWGIRNSDVFSGAGVSRSLGLIVRLCAAVSGRLAGAIVCVAEAARANHAEMGYSKDRMLVIPNGYTLTPAAEREEKQAARQRLGLPSDALIVGSVGRFNAYKDPETFVRAMGIVAPSVPAARFMMVGRDLDRANERLLSWIEATGVAERFILMGYRADSARCFAAMDCFCLHSRSEGFPNVLAEALLAGIPSVATDAGDAAIMSGGLVEIVSPGDSEALAQAVVAMCSRSQADRESLGAASRRYVETHYSLSRVAERYADLYRTILKGGDVTSV